MKNGTLRKQPTFSRRRHWFPRNDVSRNERRNSILMTCHCHDLCGSSDWSCRDASSVWNFCSRFSDFVSREHEYMVASRNVGCSLNCCRISFIKSSYFALHLALITPVKHLCTAVTYVSRQQS